MKLSVGITCVKIDIVLSHLEVLPVIPTPTTAVNLDAIAAKINIL